MIEALAGIGWIEVALIWAIMVAAAVMRAFTGFGFALVAVPALTLLMAPTEALVTCAALGLTVNLLSRHTYWGQYPLASLLPMIVMSLVGTALGVLLVSRISIAQFGLWIGMVVMLVSVVLGVYRPGRHPPGVLPSGVTGLVSGLLNGAFAIPGPPVIIFALATETDSQRSRALMMTFFLFSTVLGLVFYGVAGFFTPAIPVLLLVAFPALYVGDKLGFYLFRRYGVTRHRPVAVLMLFVVGVGTTARALLGS